MWYSNQQESIFFLYIFEFTFSSDLEENSDITSSISSTSINCYNLNIISKFRTHRKPFFFLEEDDVSMESEEEEEKKQPTSALPDKAVEDMVSKIIHKYCSSNKFRIHSLTKCVKFSNTKGFVSTFRV